MKKLLVIFTVILCILLVLSFASGCSSDNNTQNNITETESSSASTQKEDNTNSLGDYSVVIDSCRLAKDYEGKDVVIIKYVFTNNADDSTSFMVAFEDTVYQNGIGLNEAYILDDSANYSSDNQMKDIKPGSTLDVEVAYVLNDTTTDIEVEVKELFSFDDKTISKTFSIQ